MGRRRFHAAFILYKTLGYPELGYVLFHLGMLEHNLGTNKPTELSLIA